MRVRGDWHRRPETRAVCDCLTAAGHQALFVGGCVRNDLLGAPVSDIDIATEARPERVTEIAAAAGLKVVPTGIAHGTVTVVSDSVPHEITTFRRDVETDGRRAVVAFSDRIEEDAMRRDFTMNALYARPDGEIVDPLDGLPDLEARHVRFIGVAADRLREDYLRALRFFRFTAWYGDPSLGLDGEGMAAIAANLDGLPGLSRVRVGAEMLKLLNAPDPGPAAAGMAASGVLWTILPGAEARLLPVLVHLEQALGVRPDPIRRLAMLGGEDPADRFRLSKAHTRRLAILREQAGASTGAGELGYRLGDATARDVLLLRGAMLGDGPRRAELEAAQTGGAAAFPVTAQDLMPEYGGEALGRRLKALEDRWIASGFTLSREALLKG